MANKTVKLTLEGDAAFVETAARQLRHCFEVAFEGKNQRIRALSPGDERVRRTLRVNLPDQNQ